MNKNLLPGFIASIAIFVVGFLISIIFITVFPSLKAEYENIAIFRSYNDPLMYLYYFHPLVLGYILVWAWNTLKPILTGNLINRSVKFTMIYWIVAIIPGMMMSISSFQISILMVITWTATAFFQALAASFVYAKMLK